MARLNALTHLVCMLVAGPAVAMTFGLVVFGPLALAPQAIWVFGPVLLVAGMLHGCVDPRRVPTKRRIVDLALAASGGLAVMLVWYVCNLVEIVTGGDIALVLVVVHRFLDGNPGWLDVWGVAMFFVGWLAMAVPVAWTLRRPRPRIHENGMKLSDRRVMEPALIMSARSRKARVLPPAAQARRRLQLDTDRPQLTT